MSASVDIYVPAQWDTSVLEVMEAAGFRVTARDRKLSAGLHGREYSCTRDGVTITLMESAVPGDTDYRYILGLSRSKHSDSLLSAREALSEHGAIDSAAYRDRSRNA